MQKKIAPIIFGSETTPLPQKFIHFGADRLPLLVNGDRSLVIGVLQDQSERISKRSHQKILKLDDVFDALVYIAF